MLPLPEVVNDGAAQEPICSARGCRQPARHVLRWRNPKLHTDGRTKAWAACDEHLAKLSEFLGVRGFLLAVEPLQSPED
jgi:hypothetical protein